MNSGETWQHIEHNDEYEIIMLSNQDATDRVNFPLMVTYRCKQSGMVFTSTVFRFAERFARISPALPASLFRFDYLNNMTIG